MAANASSDIAGLLRSLTAYLPVNSPDGASVLHAAPNPRGEHPHAANAQLHSQYISATANTHGMFHGYYQDADSNSSFGHTLSGPQGTISLQQQFTTPQPSASVAPRIDPQTITEWPAALRYVTKLTSQYEGVIERVRKTIANQHDNERQWWDGREALISRQAARVDGRQKLDDVLRAVGVQPSQDPTVVADETAELKRYDMKVHKAQVSMVEAISGELQGLGIPFFGTKEVLIKSEDNDQGKITRQELSKLQRKMLSFLEDLCSE